MRKRSVLCAGMNYVDLLTALFLIGGCIVAGMGSIWYLVETFKASKAWGFASMCLPIVGLVFLFKYPARAWKPFAVTAGGILCIGLAAVCYAQAHPQLLDDPIAAAQRSGGAATGDGGTADAINQLNRTDH
jgi:peptidoglycan/LPS O-acetylase OafA/YrhL